MDKQARRSQNSIFIKGINYDTGVNYDKAEWSRNHWHPKAVKDDIKVIANKLHCTDITVFGSAHTRLKEASEIALRQGLNVWIQPRLIEGTREETLTHLIKTAEIAEELNQKHKGKVGLNIGCELSLFMKGILPGRNFLWRMYGLMIYWIVMPIFNRGLNSYLRKACDSVRKVFKGPLVYSAGEWEGVDWTPFDFVGVDYYRERTNAFTYTNGLRKLKSHGKPVIITEFGCCSFKGGAAKGGGGFMIVNWRKTPPEVKPGHFRDEKEQADYIQSLIELYEKEGIDGAFVYAFSEPRNLHTDDPRTDLDMASYGVVKVIKRETARRAEVWDKKEAFARLANLYSRL